MAKTEKESVRQKETVRERDRKDIGMRLEVRNDRRNCVRIERNRVTRRPGGKVKRCWLRPQINPQGRKKKEGGGCGEGWGKV